MYFTMTARRVFSVLTAVLTLAGASGSGEAPALDNLYTDVTSMMAASLHTYGYACLRKLALKYRTNFDNVASILNDHMEFVDLDNVVTFARNNEAALLALNKTEESKSMISDSSTDSFVSLWDPTKSHWETGQVSVAIADSRADDEGDDQGEAVYGMALDHKQKRIIVTFRGSETSKDWDMNFKVKYVYVNNPLYSKGSTNQPKKIRLHKGFYEYLMKEQNEGHGPKYGEIKSQLTKVLAEYPNYAVFVTGHSLGGALGTIFAFYISSEPSFDITPVSLVSFGAPLVGDEEWQTAFQRQEKEKKLRHLRVFQPEDMVAHIPFSSTALWDWGRDYKHTGIYLRMSEEGSFELRHSYLQNTRPTSETMEHISDLLDYHRPSMYAYRIETLEDELKTKQFAGLYEDKEILATLLPFSETEYQR